MMNDMTGQMTPERALERLETLCMRGERCSAELEQKLRLWKIMPGDADAIILSLRRRRFVDDGRYARAFVRDKYRFNRWGRIRIRIELRAKKISSEMIDEAMAEIDEEIYAEALSSLIETKMRSINDDDPWQRRQKLMRAAIARGYEPELVARCLDDDEQRDIYNNV